VVRWDPFTREIVGGQLARAGDSVGANIAEAFGRFHYGEKLQFLYYARGSLFEAKYWLNRASARKLMPSSLVQDYATQLSDLARQLDAFASRLKAQRHSSQAQPKKMREIVTEYLIDEPSDMPTPLFSEEELKWIEAITNT
jgi:four helix bundle protein